MEREQLLTLFTTLSPIHDGLAKVFRACDDIDTSKLPEEAKMELDLIQAFTRESSHRLMALYTLLQEMRHDDMAAQETVDERLAEWNEPREGA